MQVIYSLSLIPFFLLGFALTRRTRKIINGWEWLIDSIPLSLALLLVTVALPGRFLKGFTPALEMGAGFCVILAVLVHFFWKGEDHRLTWRFKIFVSDFPLMIFLVGASFLIAIVTFKYALNDEEHIQGHLAVIEQILRGHFPPAFTAFPDIPLKYHFGFDLIAAIFSKVLKIPAYWGSDIATLLCWFSLMGLLMLFLKSLGVPRRALGIALAWITFSGGLAWWFGRNVVGSQYSPHWQEVHLFDRKMHPFFVMYFFQHPMGLGMVFFVGALSYFKEYFEEGGFFKLIFGAFLLGSLSLAQVMIFVTLLAALGLSFLARFFTKGPKWGRNFWDGFFVLGIALVLAFSLGGFFQFPFGSTTPSFLFSWPPGYLRYEIWGHGTPITSTESLIWYLSAFGLVLFLVPFALFRAFQQRLSILWVLSFFCILGFLVPQWIRYRLTWDIIKWFFAFEFSARILTAWAFLPWIFRSFWRQTLAYLFVLLGMVSPFYLLTDLVFKNQKEFSPSEWKIAQHQQPRIQAALADLVRKLKSEPSYDGIVWSSLKTSRLLAIHTGFPMLQIDYNTLVMPLPRARIEQRKRMLAELEKTPRLELLKENKVRWIIFSCQETLNLLPEIQSFISELKDTSGIQNFSISGERGECWWAFFLPFS